MIFINLWQLFKWNWFSITGGVLCCFPVGFKESERPGCGYALTHSSFHVQGVFSIFSVNFLGPRGPHSWNTSVCPFVRKKIWSLINEHVVLLNHHITHIWAYIPSKSSEDPSNLPVDPLGSCRPTPLPPGTLQSAGLPLDSTGPSRPTPWPPGTL